MLLAAIVRPLSVLECEVASTGTMQGEAGLPRRVTPIGGPGTRVRTCVCIGSESTSGLVTVAQLNSDAVTVTRAVTASDKLTQARGPQAGEIPH